MTKTGCLAVALALVAVGGAAGRAQAAVVENSKLKGNQVFVQFSGSTEITCPDGTTSGTVSAFGFLSGSQTISRTQGSPRTVGNAVLVDVGFENTCTGVSAFASGQVIGGFSPPNRNLSSSSLEGSTTIQDFSTAAEFHFSVDVTVTGTGEVSSGKSQQHTKTVSSPGGPFTITESHFANANRSGVATGTVTIDGVTISPTFEPASLSFNGSSQIVISK